VLPQVLEIIFEAQRKRRNEKITRQNNAFQLTKCDLNFLKILWTSPIFKPHNFLFYFLFILSNLK
jgi:hypothetical protein